ncbi:MAG TPA: L-glutamate gamma-semialdehyde dehydrogenase [Patescibacteria group bacterium]|nr:L-glutamate gamma-semialdehyde dehydrogenase [Patescibacteria group bacterium]
MFNGIPRFTLPANEPIKSYTPSSPERIELMERVRAMKSETIEIPLYIGGEKIYTGDTIDILCPYDHKTVLARAHQGTRAHYEQAIENALESQKEWAKMPWHERAGVFMRAAELLAGPWRATLNGATMLGQSKNAFQAEIDSACELIDFFRFNVYYMQEIYKEQPPHSPTGIWNKLEYRPLEGFVYAVTPFNFTAIAGNLPSAPAMLGNVALWKPSTKALYSAYYLMELFKEAGLPDGVINMVIGSPKEISDVAFRHKYFAGIHYTGSTEVFNGMWKTIGENVGNYHSYPRIVGETGGKDFVFMHNSANADEVATALVRGAFEYQGQKCSAASRAYIPESKWDAVRETMLTQLADIKVGSPEDFTNFVNAVIDKGAFKSIAGYIDYVKENSKDAEIIFGGGYDDSVGYFIEPTVILAKNPSFKTMCEEIFGPVLTIHVYPDADFEKTLELCDKTSPYALTGAIFAKDRGVILKMTDALVNAAGNFYVNDKPTGAVVGQQPFGGARASGTNDKAGSHLNLLRWVSARTIKENYNPPVQYQYPFMKPDRNQEGESTEGGI